MQVQVTAHLNDAGLTRFRDLLRRGLDGPGVEPVDAMFKQWSALYSSFTGMRFDALSQGGGEWPQLAASTMQARARRLLATTAFRRMIKEGRTWHARQAGQIREFQKALLIRQGFHPSEAGAHATSIALRYFRRMGGHVVANRADVQKLSRLDRGNHRVYNVQNMQILKDTGTLRAALDIGATGNVDERRGPVMVYGIGAAPHPGPVAHGATMGAIAAYHQAGGSVPGRPPQRRILVQPDDITAAKFNTTARMMMGRLQRLANA